MDFTFLIDLVSNMMTDYLSKLDWAYMITLICISYFLSKDELLVKTRLRKVSWLSNIRPTLLSVPIVWRVFIIGIAYGLFLKWVRDYHGKDWVESLINSLVFAMVAHKLFLGRFLAKFDQHIFPEDKNKNPKL